MSRLEIAILISKYVDKENFVKMFALNPDSVRIYDASTEFPEILCDLGIFKSRSDARRNGWGKIGNGYRCHKIGKFKHIIEVYKTTDMDDKIDALLSKNPVDIYLGGLFLIQDFERIMEMVEKDVPLNELCDMIIRSKDLLKEIRETWGKDYISHD
jgi:hypothetical protein